MLGGADVDAPVGRVIATGGGCSRCQAPTKETPFRCQRAFLRGRGGQNARRRWRALLVPRVRAAKVTGAPLGAVAVVFGRLEIVWSRSEFWRPIFGRHRNAERLKATIPLVDRGCRICETIEGSRDTRAVSIASPTASIPRSTSTCQLCVVRQYRESPTHTFASGVTFCGLLGCPLRQFAEFLHALGSVLGSRS